METRKIKENINHIKVDSVSKTLDTAIAYHKFLNTRGALAYECQCKDDERLKLWHWRDLMCLLKLKLSRRGYSVREMCGRCNKCNGIFAATGVIPCPKRPHKN